MLQVHDIHHNESGVVIVYENSRAQIDTVYLTYEEYMKVSHDINAHLPKFYGRSSISKVLSYDRRLMTNLFLDYHREFFLMYLNSEREYFPIDIPFFYVYDFDDLSFVFVNHERLPGNIECYFGEQMLPYTVIAVLDGEVLTQDEVRESIESLLFDTEPPQLLLG